MYGIVYYIYSYLLWKRILKQKQIRKSNLIINEKSNISLINIIQAWNSIEQNIVTKSKWNSSFNS